MILSKLKVVQAILKRIAHTHDDVIVRNIAAEIDSFILRSGGTFGSIRIEYMPYRTQLSLTIISRARGIPFSEFIRDNHNVFIAEYNKQ